MDRHKRFKIQLYRLLILGCLLFGQSVVSADNVNTSGPHIRILLSDTHPIHQTIAKGIQREIESMGSYAINIEQLSATKLTPWTDHDLVIPIGSKALEQVLQTPGNHNIFSTLVPKNTFNEMVNETAGVHTHNIGGIYLGHPPERYYSLIRAILPEVKNVGILLGPVSGRYKTEYLNAARPDLLKLVTQTLPKGTEKPLRYLHKIIDEIDVLLALPDPTAYNPYTIQGILLSTFRNRIPVIGFSANYVKAGALAALYSTPDQLASEVSVTITNWLKNSDQPLPKQYPATFRIKLNHTVAKSMNISVSTERQILLTMQAQKGQ